MRPLLILQQALVCDHPGRRRRILGTVGPRSRRAKWLRRQALEGGWTRTEAGGDLCPDHKDARPIGPVEGSRFEPEAKGG
jgi:hypothetical protein